MSKFQYTVKSQGITRTKSVSGAVVFLALLLMAALFAVAGAMVMWGLNIIHHDWATVPALGYAASLWSLTLLGIFSGVWHWSYSKS